MQMQKWYVAIIWYHVDIVFVSAFHLFHNFVIFDDIDFKFSAVVDNIITFDVQQ